MNCVCGHMYDLRHWEDGYEKKNDFVELTFSNDVQLSMPRENLYSTARSMSLYACPKCFTVRTDEF